MTSIRMGIGVDIHAFEVDDQTIWETQHNKDASSNIAHDNEFCNHVVQCDDSMQESLQQGKSVAPSKRMPQTICKYVSSDAVLSAERSDNSCCPVRNKYVVLGGIKIMSKHRLSSHSDGDVLLHALSDAIYGCINDGNIGTHFPPSNQRWKGCSSELFVKHAQHRAYKRGWYVSFIDSSIICEEPKIMPHSRTIAENVAHILNIDSTQISVKGTTPEGLPFMGVKCGIVALVVCTMASRSLNKNESSYHS